MKLLRRIFGHVFWYGELYSIVAMVVLVATICVHLVDTDLKFNKNCDELQGVVYGDVCVLKTTKVLSRR